MKITPNSRAGDEFASLFHQAEQRDRSMTAAWVGFLLGHGYCAAHPDDGWVNRDKNEIVMQYPHFNAGITQGGLVALGWHGKWRSVRITGRRVSPFGSTYWLFEEVAQ